MSYLSKNTSIMRNSRFIKFKDNIKSLSTGQFRKLKELLEEIESIKFVSKYLETEKDEICCPHCGCIKLQKWGKVSDLQRYRCKSCRRTFNSLTNTPLANLRKKGRWLTFSKCINEGLSVRKSASECGISAQTSFRWRHRFLHEAKHIKPNKLSGIVEFKEEVYPLSFKGSKKDYDEYKKLHRIPLSQQKVVVLFSKDRYLNTLDKIVKNFEPTSLTTLMKEILTKDTLVCCEDKEIYKTCFTESGFRQGNVKSVEEVKKDIVHIKTVYNYNCNFLKWFERFHGVATKYLDSYLSWYRTLDEFNLDINPKVLLLRAKKHIKYNHQ